VIARTPSVPTHLVSARGGLDTELRARIERALLTIVAEDPSLIADVYGARSLVEVDEDEHVAPALQAVQRAPVGLDDLGG
jgi:ABC-type phosphate/phosphonate transport system substrate-binding protein